MATQSLLRDTALGDRETRVVVPRILVVDDDAAVRAVINEHLSGNYEVIETGAPETVLSLTVAHRPDAILLDLSMPDLSGYELCRALASLSFTRQIPIVVISGQAESNSAFCLSLGAVRYFRKPLDFTRLKAGLAQVLKEARSERCAHMRLPLRAILKLRAKSKDGSQVEIRAVTENIGRGGFLCACSLPSEEVSVVEVFSWDEREYDLGQARLVRIDLADSSNPRYAFQFMGPISPSDGKAHLEF